MAQLNPTYFIDDVAQAARAAEVTAADFDGGCNLAGSCAPGVGINMLGGAVVGTPEQFTLEDQHENARVGQISQHIGGLGYSDVGTSSGDAFTAPESVVRTGTVSTTGDGQITPTGNANLNSLAAGWETI